MEMTMHQWAGNVGQLIDATQEANRPWSQTMEKLVTATKTGEGVEKQVIKNKTLLGHVRKRVTILLSSCPSTLLCCTETTHS